MIQMNRIPAKVPKIIITDNDNESEECEETAVKIDSSSSESENEDDAKDIKLEPRQQLLRPNSIRFE